jgi:hypothetical protein
MNTYTTTQLATARREALIADAAYHRHYRRPGQQRSPHRATPRLRRAATALRAWIDASQL